MHNSLFLKKKDMHNSLNFLDNYFNFALKARRFKESSDKQLLQHLMTL